MPINIRYGRPAEDAILGPRAHCPSLSASSRMHCSSTSSMESNSPCGTPTRPPSMPPPTSAGESSRSPPWTPKSPRTIALIRDRSGNLYPVCRPRRRARPLCRRVRTIRAMVPHESINPQGGIAGITRLAASNPAHPGQLRGHQAVSCPAPSCSTSPARSGRICQAATTRALPPRHLLRLPGSLCLRLGDPSRGKHCLSL